MIKSDDKEFSDILDALSSYYQQKEPLNKMAVKIYFRALISYPLDAIRDAVSMHLADPVSGKFYPKAADLIKHMDGGEITVDIIVASAKLRDTPLGCCAHAMIGTWNLDNLSSFDLRQLAQQCMPNIPAWKQGQYTDHEISVMIKHGVNPAGPVLKGVMTLPPNAPELIERAERIATTKHHLLNLEAPYEAPANELPPGEVMKYLENGSNNKDIKL